MVIIPICALPGSADFSSVAIQLGGIWGLAPSRRHDLSRVGLRAMVAGSPAACRTAMVAGSPAASRTAIVAGALL